MGVTNRQRLGLLAGLAGICGIVGVSGKPALPGSALAAASAMNDQSADQRRSRNPFDDRNADHAADLLERGRWIFRYDTFGDEAFWGGTLRLHEAIEGARFGGVGPGLSPRTALAVGLKIDVEALPGDLLDRIEGGGVNLDDPAVTLALLKLKAVLGLTGEFNANGT